MGRGRVRCRGDSMPSFKQVTVTASMTSRVKVKCQGQNCEARFRVGSRVYRHFTGFKTEYYCEGCYSKLWI